MAPGPPPNLALESLPKSNRFFSGKNLLQIRQQLFGYSGDRQTESGYHNTFATSLAEVITEDADAVLMSRDNLTSAIVEHPQRSLGL